MLISPEWRDVMVPSCFSIIRPPFSSISIAVAFSEFVPWITSMSFPNTMERALYSAIKERSCNWLHKHSTWLMTAAAIWLRVIPAGFSWNKESTFCWMFSGKEETAVLKLIPVSYTHLDVYKRQAQHSASNVILHCDNHSHFHTSWNLVSGKTK